jgi:hypothetical protein
MSQLTRKDDLIHNFVEVVVNSDPELFTIGELTKRIRSKILKMSDEEILSKGQSETEFEATSRRIISNRLDDILKMFTHHSSGPNIQSSLKRILKAIVVENNGDEVIEELLV